MKTIKKIMAALICMTIALTGIPISVKAADSSGSMSTEMETNSELFITLEENKDYRWNVNDNAGKIVLFIWILQKEIIVVSV